MPLVAFDSNICIWCIKHQCTEGQEQEMNKAIQLANLLSKANYEILIPIPVVTELLSSIPDPDERIKLYKKMQSSFQIGMFDEKAAIILAEILNYHFIASNKSYQQLGLSKTPLKYDALLIAIAKASGAEALYAHDKGCRSTAAHFLSVLNLDERPRSIVQDVGIFQADMK
jgi:predicted nucleic acid-binding protein